MLQGFFPAQGLNHISRLLHCRRFPALGADSLLTGPPGKWQHDTWNLSTQVARGLALSLVAASHCSLLPRGRGW